jgi:hypothetical protein
MRYGAMLLALLVLACDGSGPSEPTIAVSAKRTWGLPAPPTFRAQAPQLIIAGTIDLNEPCYEFAGSVDEARDTVVVRLHARRRNQHCPQELARFNYTLTIVGLEPGVQPLRLVYDRVGPPTFVEVAFEGAVVVE